jgi:TRAP-type C4-dicarboxylate transport system permease large subunit
MRTRRLVTLVLVALPLAWLAAPGSARVQQLAARKLQSLNAMREFARSFGAPVVLLVIVCLVYLVLGTVFEDFSLMIILLPFVLPAVQAAGPRPAAPATVIWGTLDA